MSLKDLLEALPESIEALNDLYRGDADEEEIEDLKAEIERDVTNICVTEEGEPDWSNIQDVVDHGVPVFVAGTTVYLKLSKECIEGEIITEDVPLAHPQE